MRDFVVIEACQARQDALAALIWINRVVAVASQLSEEQAWVELMLANSDVLPGHVLASKDKE